MNKKTVTLKQWIEATTEIRSNWLKSGYELLPRDYEIFTLINALKAAGASISDKAILEAIV